MVALFSVSLSASTDPIELSEPFYSRPVLYGGEFYGFSDSETFSKVTDAGQVSWRIQDKLDAEKPFDLHFNHLVFLQKDGSIIAYDAALGNEIWSYNDVVGTSFFIRHPYVMVLTKQGRILSLDLFTGRLKWKTKVKGMKAFRPAGRSGIVVGRRGKSLHYFETQTGSKIKTIPLKSTSHRFVSDWNRKVVLQAGGRLNTIDVESGKITLSDVVPSENMTWFQTHYPVVADEIKGVLRQYDLETGALQWETFPTHNIQDVHFGESFALLTVPSDNSVLVDMKNGSSYFREKDDVEGAVQGVYDGPDTLYIMYRHNLVKIDKAGLDDE